MPKTIFKLLSAGTIGFVSIIGGYGVLSLPLFDKWLPQGASDVAIITTLLAPIAVGLFIAWAVYRVLDRIWR